MLKAQEELNNQPWMSEAGARWFKQINEDLHKHMQPYDIIKEDNKNHCTFFVYYVNREGNPICIKRIAYIADGPFKLKESIDFVDLTEQVK